MLKSRLLLTNFANYFPVFQNTETLPAKGIKFRIFGYDNHI
ncbi:hypothetical protein M23134_01249 [Microscilla marina ATCC 23134]|uniref:Uncharacterized protein n=1 Tax=Microscilla marina ATCC 23134 TaxID=313606 RepID=A1ZG01_MICM2|nr:hypothetical protein M23134_01249 [Microscilla marina ATCC 23134]